MLVNQFCIRAQDGKELKFSVKELGKQPVLPLIWFNQGMYGVISLEKLQNMYEAMEDQKKLPVLDRKKDVGKFYWDECVIIPPKIAKLLFGKNQ